MVTSDLLNWIPYKITSDEEDIYCHWLDTLGKPFTEPFFDETIAVCKSLSRVGFYRRSVSDLASLINWSGQYQAVTPTAIIFHVSRCGSTLISQLLGMNEEHISLAEVPVLDDILRLPYRHANYNGPKVGDLFKAALKFYSRPGTGDGKRLFIKADSWHTLFYHELRELYPDVPFILLYRKPDEVLQSHIKLRGIHAVPGLIEPEVFDFNKQELKRLNLDEYLAKVLGTYLECYKNIVGKDARSLLINYNQGANAMLNDIAGFCGFEISEAELLKIKERSGFHSKYPNLVFNEERLPDAPAFLQNAIAYYNALDRIRLSKITP